MSSRLAWARKELSRGSLILASLWSPSLGSLSCSDGDRELKGHPRKRNKARPVNPVPPDAEASMQAPGWTAVSQTLTQKKKVGWGMAEW